MVTHPMMTQTNINTEHGGYIQVEVFLCVNPALIVELDWKAYYIIGTVPQNMDSLHDREIDFFCHYYVHDACIII